MESCAIVPLTHSDDLFAATTPVAGEAPLVRVVRSVMTVVAGDRVVVATLPVLVDCVRDCLEAAGLEVAVAVSGEPGLRYEVIRAALEYLGAEPHTSAAVLVCDHGFPLSPGELAERVLSALRDGREVVVPTVPVTDTVKTVDETGWVLGTVDRSTLQTVQSPRGFTASALWQLVSTSPATGPTDVDEFDAALRAGLDIGTVAGDPNAFRVELPRDAHLFEAVIACRPD
ncbi:MAG: 2-C-methyl-D-erythritol 4-phosphate cytidylyltransferase [Mycobacterium sp.]|jgi:2-C-methyl-D-erythritol 4-phosphate cytidylyltransferase|nr:2-C-methyl-D-erythritol 4-phosphate cytidylyltransferase [Mycobacterium sp.]